MLKSKNKKVDLGQLKVNIICSVIAAFAYKAISVHFGNNPFLEPILLILTFTAVSSFCFYVFFNKALSFELEALLFFGALILLCNIEINNRDFIVYIDNYTKVNELLFVNIVLFFVSSLKFKSSNQSVFKSLVEE